MTVGKIIKRTIQLLAGLGLCPMFGFPLLNAYFDAHPEAAAVLDGAAEHVDPAADKVTQASQFVGNIGKSRHELVDRKREEAEDKAFEEADRKRDEMRRFNTGALESD
jgi:uncharacterized protein YPO0396